MKRLSWATFASIGALGATYPFLALELRGRGVTGWLLTAAMIASPLLRLTVGPAWGAWSDRREGSGHVVLAAAVCMALGAVWLAGAPGLLVLGGVILHGIGRVGVDPLLDGLIVRTLGADRERYGRVRLWGSVGFLLSVYAGGALSEHYDISPLWLAAALSLGLVVSCVGLPRSTGTTAPVELLPALRELGRDRYLGAVLAVSALHFAGISIYDSYFAIHVENLGLPRSVAGAAFALGVLVEVGVLRAGGWLLQRVGARRLFLLGVLISLPRWVLTATISDPWLLVGVQAIHGIGFGAFWVAAIELVSERAPRRLQSSAQGLLGAAVGGVGSLTGNLLGSRGLEFFEDSGQIFWISLVLCGLAAVVALLGLRPRPVAQT